MTRYVPASSVNFSSTTFRNNQNITSVDLKNIPFVNNSMDNAFRNAINLVSVTNINGYVTNMYRTFQHCDKLVDAPTIPNSVTTMNETFTYCANLVNAPTIPESVKILSWTFMYCNSLVNAPIIPNSVTRLVQTFMGCTNLTNPPAIPNSVIDASGFISACPLCFDPNKYPEIPQTVQCLDYMYSAMSNTETDVPQWCMDKWNNCSVNVKTSMVGMFTGWHSLRNAPVIPNSVTNISYMFNDCINLVNIPVIPNSVINMACTFQHCINLINIPELPNSIKKMWFAFGHCNHLITAPNIPESVIELQSAFTDCTNLTGDINILSNQITNAVNCFTNTTLTKNVYIPFTYENGVNTATYNAFTEAGYDTLGTQHGVYLKDINPAPAPRKVLNVEDYTYTSDAEDNVILETYTGASTLVKIPVIEDKPSETAYYAWKNGSTIVYTLQSTPDFHIDVYSDTNQTYYGYIKDIDSSTEVTIRHEGVDTMFERYSAGDVVVPDVDLSYGSND